MLSRCLRYGRGLRVGAVDINDWPQDNSGNNPLDLATSAGMAFLALSIYLSLYLFMQSFYFYKYTYIYIYNIETA